MGLRSQDSVEGGSVFIFKGNDIIEVDREGEQGKCDVYGDGLWSAT